ncbi:MAG: hypothetical protein ACK4QP_01830 [Pseudorhizobium sp.]
MDERQVELTGNVFLETVDAGSKSERQAVIFRTADGQAFTLRLADQPSFGASGLAHLAGSSITIQGVAVDQTLLIQHWKVND